MRWGKDEDGKARGRPVENFKRQSRQLEKKETRMESAAEFAADVEEGDRLISFDIKAGYRHLFLQPIIRDLFISTTMGDISDASRCPSGGAGRRGVLILFLIRLWWRHGAAVIVYWAILKIFSSRRGYGRRRRWKNFKRRRGLLWG